MATPSVIIPITDLPVAAVGDLDYLIATRSDGSAAVRTRVPELVSASQAVQDAIDEVVANAEQEANTVLNSLGYLVPVPYASGVNVTNSRYTVSYDGSVYAPVSVPFTTSASFDPTKWRVIQGVTTNELSQDSGASLVGFKQIGTGAVYQTLLDEVIRTVRPEHFGAVGNGIVDDSAAITAAYNRVMQLPRGGVLTFTPGKNYALGSRLTFPKVAGKRLQIEGNGAMLVHASGYTGVLAYFGEPTNSISAPPFRINNLQFGGPFGATGVAPFVELENANGTAFYKCSFVSGETGVSQEESFSVTYNGCMWTNCHTYGVAIVGGAMNTTFERCGFYDVGQCDVYFTQKTYNINFRDSDFEGGGQAVAFVGGIDQVAFDGCYIEAKTSLPIFFAAASNGVDFCSSWLGYCAEQQWTNISNSNINGNIFVDQPQTVNQASCQNLNVGNGNVYQGSISNRIFSSWTPVTLTNGFSNTGSPYHAASYFVEYDGVVRMRGMVQASADSNAFQMPVGLRPGATMAFQAISANGSVARITISSGGQVACFRGSDNTVDLSSVNYRPAS